MHGKFGRRRRGAFTLIELLVVVAIIALLISILLPTLSRAKEQARVAKCLANLRSIGQAGAAYLLDDEDLPWTATDPLWADGQRYNFGAWTEFYWGGGMPSKTGADWNQVKPPGTLFEPMGSDVYRVPVELRPMNPYIAPQVSWADPRRVNSPLRVQIAMELPDNFKCPSDTSIDVPGVGLQNSDSEAELAATTWEFWGSSYPISWYWAYYYVEAPPGNQPPYSGSVVQILGGLRSTPSLGPRLVGGNQAGGFASRLILFYENRMNFAMEAARPRGAPQSGGQGSQQKALVGWHRQLDQHAAAFMDGHASYQKFDTRFVDGSNWTTWPNRPWEGTWEQYQGF